MITSRFERGQVEQFRAKVLPEGIRAPGFTEKPRRANRRRYEMALVQTSPDRLTLRDFSYVCPTCG